MLRTLDDAARIRAALGPGRRLAVIGGGFIGLELAASARKLGTEVTVIEALPRLLTRGVPAEVAAVLAGPPHRAEGVASTFGARIAEITADGGVFCRTEPTIPADLVVIGIGAIPNTELAAACRPRGRERHRRRRDARHLRSGCLRRRRLLLVPAAAL